MIGRTIGKYRVVAQLGRGGMGTVYKAVDETLDREVAIKILNPELADTEIMNRFRAEATTLAKLNHPEIATIYELFRTDSDLLMVMEFVRGETLDKLSERLAPLQPERAACLVDKVLSALGHAHRAGIVHRDMKPANVMVTGTGAVKIMDFGIARVRGAEHMTMDGYMMGTPAYMSPEQVLGQEVDGRADLYSVGVIFYRLLTGTLPFKADTAIGMVQKQISDTPTPLRLHRDGLPDWCEGLLQRALAKSPADRFQTAEAFQAAIGRATGHAVVEETTASSPADRETTTPITPIRPITPIALLLEAPGSPLSVSAPFAASGSTARVMAMEPGTSIPAVGRVPATIEAATIVLRRRHFAMTGSMLGSVALGVAVLAYVTLRRAASVPTTANATTSSVAAPTTPASSTEKDLASPASTPSATRAATPPAALTIAPPTSSAPVTTPGPTMVATGTAGGPSALPQPALAGMIRPTNNAREAAAADAPDTMSAVSPADRSGGTGRTFLPLAFDAKALVMEGSKQRERDATVHFADGKVIVVAEDDPKDVVHDIPYDAILSISYSTGRDPLWNSPKGPAAVARAGGGLGFLRGLRHWVTLRTRNAADRFVVLRFSNDVQVRRAIKALEERTSHRVELVVEHRDAR